VHRRLLHSAESSILTAIARLLRLDSLSSLIRAPRSRRRSPRLPAPAPLGPPRSARGAIARARPGSRRRQAVL
jgi:hypothetical protein